MLPSRAITKDTTIAEAMRICSAAPEILSRHGLDCYVCLAAPAETIEEAALMHDLDVRVILDELNAACAEVDESKAIDG